jgi:hypothetical protein
MAIRRLTAVIEREGDGFVALCPEVDVASQGDTIEQVLRLLDKLDERLSWRPTSAAHPRPGGRPYYIAPNCPTCGTPLVLWDRLNERLPLADDQVWYDEWICPHCRDGIWMDWPASEWEWSA